MKMTLNVSCGISVIVVTYNRPKDLKETVDSLLGQSLKPLEIIVIDDGSNPPLSMKFDIKNLRLIRFDKEVGLSNARNYGINISKGAYVAFIDDDAIADKNWLKEIQKGIEKGGDVLGGPLKPIYEAHPPKWWNEKNFGYYAGVGNIFFEYIFGANMVIKKEVFKKVGFFRSEIGRQKGKLLGYEEIDLFDRIRRRGYNFLFVPKAMVYHKVKPQKMTLKYILKWEYYGGKSVRKLYGCQPLRTSIHLFKGIIAILNPRSILYEKSVKIKKIARIATLFGQLI